MHKDRKQFLPAEVRSAQEVREGLVVKEKSDRAVHTDVPVAYVPPLQSRVPKFQISSSNLPNIESVVDTQVKCTQSVKDKATLDRLVTGPWEETFHLCEIQIPDPPFRFYSLPSHATDLPRGIAKALY